MDRDVILNILQWIGAFVFSAGLVCLIGYAIMSSVKSGTRYKTMGFANPTEIWFMSHPLEGMLVAIVGTMAVIILISLFFARKRF